MFHVFFQAQASPDPIHILTVLQALFRPLGEYSTASFISSFQFFLYDVLCASLVFVMMTVLATRGSHINFIETVPSLRCLGVNLARLK